MSDGPVQSSDCHDVAAVEAKARLGNGLRVAAEASNKPLRLRMGYLTLGQPFLLKTGAITQEEVDQLYQQALDEMQSEQFCALWYLLTVWGEKAK